MAKRKKYNPEKRAWKGKSYKKGVGRKRRTRIRELKDADAEKSKEK